MIPWLRCRRRWQRSHGTAQSVGGQHAGIGRRPKLATSVRMNYRAVRITKNYSMIESIDGQLRSHPGIHRVANNPVGEGVLDRTQVQFPGSRVECSVMSVSHTASAVRLRNWRSTKSSPTGGPGLRLRPRTFACTEWIFCRLHNLPTRFSETR